MGSCRKILVLLLSAVFLLGCVSRVFVEVSLADARTVLDNASASLENAYEAVREAEVAGANVTVLKAKLAEGGVLLAYANASLSIGNYTGAVTLALQANQTVKGMAAEASALAAAARENWSAQFNWSILETGIGLSLAVFSVMVGWVYFRRYYVRRVLSLKPEVNKDEP